MSQPFDRAATADCPGEPDPSLGEFWVKDPFQINWENNLSSYERNRAFLNVGGKHFLEISHLTSADSDGDARACVAADLDGDGREELIVRQSGGGGILIFENRFPAGNWLEVVLQGKESNRHGIGARLTPLMRRSPEHRRPLPTMPTSAAISTCSPSQALMLHYWKFGDL